MCAMEKVRLQDDCYLLDLKHNIADVRSDMQDNLKNIRTAFDDACSRWNDKNATTCSNLLIEHNSSMRLAFEQLESIEAALARLSELAETYQNI